MRKNVKWGVFFPAGPVDAKKWEIALAHLQATFPQIAIRKFPVNQSPFFAQSMDELMEEWEFFRHRPVDFLMAARGGMGSIRLLNLLDSGKIQPLDSIIVGFSDLTALFWGLWRKYEKISIYGPVATFHFANHDQWETRNQFMDVVNGAHELRFSREEFCVIKPFITPSVQGILLPVCLSVFAEIAEKHENQSEKFILVLEDTNEKAYRLLRYLYLLEYKGYLSQCSALLIGDLGLEKEREGDFMKELLKLVEENSFPVITGIPFGHHLKSYSLPFGVKAEMDSETRVLRWKNFISVRSDMEFV